MNKTVALVSTQPPDRGNLAEHGHYLLQALGNNPGVRHVHAIANRVPGAPQTERLSDRITIHRAWTLGDAASLWRLPSFIRSLKPDVVHVNAGLRTWGAGRVVNFVGAATASRCNAFAQTMTTLHTIGDTVRLDQLDRGIGPITRAGIAAATRLYLRSHIVTVTLRSMQAALHNHYNADNVRHVAHGTYGPRVERPPLAPMRVLSFGFWGAYKDASLMVSSVQKLNEEGLPVELVLGGGAHPYHPEIYDELKRRYASLPFVKFTGYIPEQDLDALFKSVACVVQPYRTNAGASGVLNLARSYGRPLVISADPGLLEQVHDEGGSALVFRSEAQLVDALRRVVTDPALAMEMGEKNLAVARRMDIGTQAQEMTRYYVDDAAQPRAEFGKVLDPTVVGELLDAAGPLALAWPR